MKQVSFYAASAALAAVVAFGMLAEPLLAQEKQQEKKAPQPERKAQPAAAQKKTPPAEPIALGDVPLRIGIIDMDAIRRDANAAKDIRDQINKYRQTFQAEIQKEEDELRNANQELARQRSIISPEAFAAERKKFEERLGEVGRLLEHRKQELERTHGEALGTVNKVLQEIVVEVANEVSLTLVLRRDQTVLSAKALEITDDVLQRLNKKMPSLKVAAPGK